MNSNPFTQVVLASKSVLSNIKYLATFLFVSLLASVIFVYIPVKTIPGNNFRFQLSIFTLRDYMLLSILSILTGLLFTMNIYMFIHQRTSKNLGNVGLGGSSGGIAAIFGTAACSSCIAAIFGFLGLPAVYFFIEARPYIVGITISILVASLYFASKNVNKICNSCIVNKQRKIK